MSTGYVDTAYEFARLIVANETQTWQPDVEIGGLPAFRAGWIIAVTYAILCYVFYRIQGTHVFAMVTHGTIIPLMSGFILMSPMQNWGTYSGIVWWISLGYFLFLLPMDMYRFRPVFLAHHLASLYLFYDHVSGCRSYHVLVTGALVVDTSSVWLGLRTHLKFHRLKYKFISPIVDLGFVFVFCLPRLLYTLPLIYTPVVLYGSEVYQCGLPEWRVNMVRLMCVILIACNMSWITEILYNIYLVFIVGKKEGRNSADELRPEEKEALRKQKEAERLAKEKGVKAN